MTDGRQYQAGIERGDVYEMSRLGLQREVLHLRQRLEAAERDAHQKGSIAAQNWETVQAFEQRAQRAEAECERLRERERQLYDALWTLNGHAMLYMGGLADNVSEEVGAALATPPPAHSDDHE